MSTPFDPEVHRRVLTDGNGNPIPQVYDPDANNGDGGFVPLTDSMLAAVIDAEDIDIAKEATLSGLKDKVGDLLNSQDEENNILMRQTGSVVQPVTFFENESIPGTEETGDIWIHDTFGQEKDGIQYQDYRKAVVVARFDRSISFRVQIELRETDFVSGLTICRLARIEQERARIQYDVDYAHNEIAFPFFVAPYNLYIQVRNLDEASVTLEMLSLHLFK